MKPHLRMYLGVWHCGFPRFGGLVGLGYTPKQAYERWARHYRSEARKMTK